MKKLLCVFLTLCLLGGLVGCKPTENADNPPMETPAEMPAEMEKMAAPMDALARCMLENNITYAPDDPEFFWMALYYFTGGYGLAHPLATEDAATYQLILPAEAMQEYAAALFALQEEMPAMPADMEGNITFDAEENLYRISRGDIGLSECRLADFAETENGCRITAQLWSTGDSIAKIAAWDVELVKGAEDAFYPYRIASMTLQPEEAGQLTEIVTQRATAVFNGLADSHTAEITFPDGTVEAFQFDPDSEVAKILSALQEGDGITIQYTNAANGGQMILDVE